MLVGKASGCAVRLASSRNESQRVRSTMRIGYEPAVVSERRAPRRAFLIPEIASMCVARFGVAIEFA
jgi:hypothetical protein